MNKIDKKFNEIRRFCETNSDPVIVKKYSRYFKEGFDLWQDNYTVRYRKNG